MRVHGMATTASRGMKGMVIMTVAAAGLVIGAGTAAVDPGFGPGNNPKGVIFGKTGTSVL
jgi:hypothetical protein